MSHHVDLSTIVLQVGSHEAPGPASVCLMEAVAWFAGEPHSDTPACVSPVLGAFGRSWNDGLDDANRQRLVAFIPRLVGTAGDEAADERRAWMATDWVVRVHVPACLRAAGLTDHADALAGLPTLDSPQSAFAAQPTINGAGAAARGAATAAAAAGAGAADRDAATDAADWAAAAWAGAVDAAGAAAAGAGAAARGAATAAAAAGATAFWAGAGAVAKDATDWDAAWDAVIESAFDLFDRMIAA